MSRKNKHLKPRLFTQKHKTEPTNRGFSFLSSWPRCAYCSMRASAKCEFPGCDRFMCKKHAVLKGGGKLCPDHKGARLLQDHAHPDPGSVAVMGLPSTKFKPKGPALPNPKGLAYAAIAAEI